MRRLFISLTLLIYMYSAAAQVRKAVFVIVDGIPADLIEKLPTPHLDDISRAGGFKRVLVGGEKNAYSQTPTISAVGYNTVLTGTWVNKHNVWDNDIADPDYHYKTIFRLLKDQDSSKKTGVYSSWLDNRTRLVNMPVDDHYDGLELDTIRFPHDKKKDYMQAIDQSVTDTAAAHIRSFAPDLSWVYLEYTDDMGHMHGDSPEFYKAIESMDKKMGQLWEAIRYRQKNFHEDWLLIITTDHGRDAETGRNHGGQSDRERLGWIATNAKQLNDRFKAGHPSIADIMPTVARFLHVNIPQADLREIDGTPLIGPIGAMDAAASLDGDVLTVTWKKTGASGNAKIWLTKTNHFKTGGQDEYMQVASVPVSQEKAVVNVQKQQSDFYKVVIETPQNTLNRWIIVNAANKNGKTSDQ